MFKSLVWLDPEKKSSELKIGAWRYRVSAGTGRHGVRILWLGEVESWIYNVYLSVAARKIVWADSSQRCTSLLLGREATNKQRNKLNSVICAALKEPQPD